MEKTATLNLRVNPAVKENAEAVLSKLGIPMSTAINMYLNQISLTGGIPFPVTVKISDKAQADMEQIYSYIAKELMSPRNALGQYKRIADAISRLDIMPERFQSLDFGNLNGLRRMPVDKYLVFYVIENGCVIVTNVLYSASNILERIEKCEL